MDFKSDARGDRLVIAISGVITFDDHNKFRGILNAIADSAATTIEISLADTKMLDSAGVGMILLANDRAKKADKTLRLSGVTGHVAKVLELSRIAQILPVD
ncbi:STAS domain-containing protein [Maricaulis sp.]|uniref:STAS domain-containing protein n=1 Tax=Maricaulis sp. TaxID=1486257 RepID=UPI0025C0B216|nr:STAS domain-containing protein [Maricaulis sp.]